MDNSKHILKVEDLTVKIGNQTILNKITFEIEQGSFLAIIGPNGSGKSMLIKTLIGTIPYEGKIEWASGTKIGYVPQKAELDRYLTVTLKDFLNLKAKILKLPEEAVKDAITSASVPKDFLETPLAYLSGGHLQRGLIAFALLGNPQIIFFDEPTASVDSLREEQIYQTLHRLQDEKKVTIVIVSHDLELVRRYSEAVICLNKELLCYGSLEKNLTPEMLDRLYGTKTHVHHLHEHSH